MWATLTARRPHSSELDKLLEAYVSNHYHDGVCATYALPDPKYPAPEPTPAAVEEPVEEQPEPAKDEPMADDAAVGDEPKPEVDDGETKMEVEETDEPKEVVPEVETEVVPEAGPAVVAPPAEIGRAHV